MADGKKCGRARLEAEGYQDPGLREGNVAAAGCVRLRSFGAIEKRRIWSLDIKDACPQADGFGRDVSLLAPTEWELPRG